MRVAYEIGDFFFRYISPSHLSLSLFTFHESEWRVGERITTQARGGRKEGD